MLNISFFAAAVLLETLLLLLITSVYFFYRDRRTRSVLRDLSLKLRAAETKLITNNATIANVDVDADTAASDNKQMIIEVLLEKLDCFDENNSELEDFRKKFSSLREEYATLRNAAADEGLASSDTSAGEDQQNDLLQEKFTTLEQELQQILNNASTIVGQINREKMQGK